MCDVFKNGQSCDLSAGDLFGFRERSPIAAAMRPVGNEAVMKYTR
jgi:hypothetical protein